EIRFHDHVEYDDINILLRNEFNSTNIPASIINNNANPICDPPVTVKWIPKLVKANFPPIIGIAYMI
ncbi:MAG TPA: hypothetical protein DEO84_04685, partial [candidate division Zixibacteria bacterium]|nr:hypothetical protein [candidate division Zixibacteria bacterium]